VVIIVIYLKGGIFLAASYRKHDCYKCGNEKCSDEFSQFIPSFVTAVSDVVECENFTPAGSEAKHEEKQID
jgi:hypothetical protein